MALAVAFQRADVEQSITARFESQVAAHHDRQAVQAAGGTLSYGELDALANQVGRAVLDRTDGDAGRVALLCSNDLLTPAAVLGALKSGGQYVPLHVRHPPARNAIVLDDAGARVLLCDRAHREMADALAARAAAPVAVVTMEDDVGRFATAGLGRYAAPLDPCAILYTSGSTGRPKGVVHTHRNLLYNTWIYVEPIRIAPGDRLSLLHSLTAIGSGTALYAALLNGATICPLDPVRAGAAALATWIDRERVTVLHVVPTVFRHLSRALGAGRRLDGLRLVRLGGEAVTRDEWLAFRAHCREHASMLMGLGSTESGNCRQAIWPWSADPPGAVLPVGTEVPEKATSLRDADGNVVPRGTVGELVVRSEFLFQGYWRQPELTARVLQPDPEGSAARVFRTGDLGREDADGHFRHMGRVDFQVKIAGNRVETAEIEHALRGVAGIEDAAVVPRRRGPGGVGLVAFVATGGAPPVPASTVRAALREHLPLHMIPAAIVAVDALPLLPEGKIDRRTLMDRVASVDERSVRPPSNPVEETLLEIWQRALDVDGIGMDDDFVLDLGGDSLAAVRVLADVGAMFGRELSLDVFLEPTSIASLAARLDADGWQPPASGRLVLHADGTRPPLFAVCGAFGHALRLLLLGRTLGPEQPFYGLQPPAMDWERAGCTTIEAMAAHYVAEMRRVQAQGPYRLLGTSLGGLLVFEMAVQLQRAGDGVSLLAMVDTQPPDCETPTGLDRAPRRVWSANAADDDGADRLVTMGVRVARSHRVALDRYVLRRRFDGTIVYFRCLDEPVPATGDRRGLWASFATDGLRVVPVPGRHGGFHRDPQCSAVADGLRASG
ncbi:MAG TPA: AMP-binding protein [Candidatus Binatia bacterium]|jgi:amino acid adenylation domain-containing protein|nr:AMP-binding protein [Candidatus Binatia bacterium]